MGLLNMIFGKSYEDHERSGDTFFRDRVWGQAKIEYETALYKLEKNPTHRKEDIKRLQEKFGHAREALSFSHKQDGEEMMESGSFGDARALLALALELTQNPDLERELKRLIKEADDGILLEKQRERGDFAGHDEDTESLSETGEGDDYFIVLCSTLPPHIQKRYMGYGTAFREGYVALNNGEFERAAEMLSKAMEENPFPDTYIPFELATAYLNLDQRNEAEELLKGFLMHHPDSLPAYQALCEIYWERGEYGRAEELLESCPEDLVVSVGAFLLRGETLYQAGKYPEAKAFYNHTLERFGWHGSIAGELAKVHVALGEKESARHIYGRILKESTGCGTRPDPFIKRKYADLILESGEYTSQVLELYLSLAQEDPENSAEYFIKASRIFEEQGNPEEARRFRLLSERHDKE
jgi:tetratricopeptide (TPR) repeat protein